MNPENFERRHIQEWMENSVNIKQYEHFEQWVDNFALNLKHIWNEKSAKELTPVFDPVQNDVNSAIVIGRGPSIKKKDHLKILAESNYQGSIVCCDGKLIDVLKAGITPNRFPKFHVVTIEPYSTIEPYYDHKLIEEFGPSINALFTTIIDPNVANKARENGLKIHWMHSLFDYDEGKKSFNNISSLMVRSKKQHGLPAIQTGGNVGTSSWFVSWQILKCNVVSLIGINHGWEDDDPLNLILSHTLNNNQMSEQIPKIDMNEQTLKKFFPKIHNPDVNAFCILDPIFEFYRGALIEFIYRSPTWLKTVNATEGGSIFGERIHSMKFRDFLEKYQY